MSSEADAKKERLGPREALELAAQVSEIYAARGKKVERINLAKDKPGREALLKVLLGPSGNLRAPTARVGKKLLVGFDPEMYGELLS